MSIQITRLEYPSTELRHMARVASDPDQARRLLAIASILDGASRADAARNAGMERQTLRDWVHRYNAEGLAGLKDRPRAGRSRCLTGAAGRAWRLVETRPDPVQDGVVRWRCDDLSARSRAASGSRCTSGRSGVSGGARLSAALGAPASIRRPTRPRRLQKAFPGS